MDTSTQFCPNLACSARGQIGQGNIRVHDRKRQRYRCKICQQTFSARRGTMFEGLRTSTELIVIVVTLLAFGCPVQAIVQAYGLDERTVASWRDRAGKQCQRVHQALVEQGQVDLVQVQADEIRVKARGMIAWMGLAIMVSTRLWLGGVVSRTRDSSLADRLLLQVRACAQAAGEVLICTDGWAAYPASIRRAFRDKVKQTAGRGRAHLQIWSGLHIGTVIKHTIKKRLTEVVRQMSHGSLQQAMRLLQRGGGRADAQHVLHRTVQWYHARTTGHLNTQMSSCRSTAAGTGNRDVLDGQHLQLLLLPSGTEQALVGRSIEATATNSCDGQWSDRPYVESL